MNKYLVKYLLTLVIFIFLCLSFPNTKAQNQGTYPPGRDGFEYECLVNFPSPGGGSITALVLWDGDGSRGGEVRTTSSNGITYKEPILYFDPATSCISN